MHRDVVRRKPPPGRPVVGKPTDHVDGTLDSLLSRHVRIALGDLAWRPHQLPRRRPGDPFRGAGPIRSPRIRNARTSRLIALHGSVGRAASATVLYLRHPAAAPPNLDTSRAEGRRAGTHVIVGIPDEALWARWGSDVLQTHARLRNLASWQASGNAKGRPQAPFHTNR